VGRGPVTRFLGPDNILAWPDEFTGGDLSALPAATALQVDKHFFRHAVTVRVSERERVGIWCFESGDPEVCFWFDRGGVLFMPGYAAEGNLTPVLRDHSRDPLVLGAIALPQRLLTNLLTVFSALDSLHLSIREVRLEDLALEEVRVLTHEGPSLLFSLRFPATGVANAVAVVGNQAALSQLEYIDFRVEGKVYYR
jgi:hypothetical protein